MDGTIVAWAGVIAVVALLALSLGWRWASRRFTLPCPSAFSWMVDGSVAEAILKTERTLDRIGMKPGQRVLELGPGPGRLLIRAAKRVLPDGKVVGIELQADMIRKLQAKAREAGVANLEVVQGDASKTTLDEEPFDIAYLSTVLGEIPDRASALRNVYRMLKPGGRLSVAEIILDPHYQSRKTVADLAARAGFEPDETLGSFAHFTANFRKPPANAGPR